MRRTRLTSALLAGALAAGPLACAPDASIAPSPAHTPRLGPALSPSEQDFDEDSDGELSDDEQAMLGLAEEEFDEDDDGELSAAEKAALKGAKKAARAARKAEKESLEQMRKEWKLYQRAVKAGAVRSELLRCEPLKRMTETRTIGPKGGEIRLGEHRLVVPAGALASAVTITAVAPTGPLVDLQFEPHGLQFARPVTLTISYRHCIVPEWKQLGVVYLGNGYKVLDEQPSADDRANTQVDALTDHFSGYAIATGRTR